MTDERCPICDGPKGYLGVYCDDEKFHATPTAKPVADAAVTHNHDPNFSCSKCFSDGEQSAHDQYEDADESPVADAAREHEVHGEKYARLTRDHHAPNETPDPAQDQDGLVARLREWSEWCQELADRILTKDSKGKVLYLKVSADCTLAAAEIERLKDENKRHWDNNRELGLSLRHADLRAEQAKARADEAGRQIERLRKQQTDLVNHSADMALRVVKAERQRDELRRECKSIADELASRHVEDSWIGPEQIIDRLRALAKGGDE